MDTAAWEWAREQFGDAELGDRRRVDRLVQVAARAARGPAGTVTAVFETSAEREGAFRMLESTKVTSDAVGQASHIATVHQCRKQEAVYVAIDGSSLALRDLSRKRDIGQVGNWSARGRGLLVASALAVSRDGTPIGLCGQRYWARTERSKRLKRFYSLKTETRHGVQLLEQVHALFAQHSPEVEPWYQLDRGYDAWAILQVAHEKNLRMTVRVAHDRTVRAHKKAPKKGLFPCVNQAPVLGYRFVQVPARGGRPARTAKLEVRARKVTVELHVARKRRVYFPVYVVSARELNHNKPVHWRLMTTVPVQSLTDAVTVIDGYTTRWRVEEFHRAWKRGVCNVEDTQLRARESILKWATILAAVAARATRLTYLARETPEVAATQELSRWEVDAAIVLRRPKDVARGATPTLAEAVRWIADLGGYTGKSSGGPPGPTVIGRGLAKVELLATALKTMDEM
jgi:ribonuclease HI